MSLSGSGGSQYGPQCSDLFPQLGNASGIVQHHISRGPALFPGGLRCNPGLCLCSAESVARYQPLDLSFLINIDGDDEIEILLLAGLD